MDSQTREQLMGLGSWGICSIGMVLFNKLAVTAFPLECTLVCLQMLFTVLCMAVFCRSSLHIGSWHDLLRWSMVVPFFAGMLLTSMFALSKASMATVVTFRSLSPIVSLIIERCYPNPLAVSIPMVFSLVIMVGGAALYAKDLPQSEHAALGWIVLNNVCAIGDRLLQRLMLARDQRPVDMSKTAITLANNALGFIPLLAAAYFHGELSLVGGTMMNLDLHASLLVVSTCIVGVGISYCGIWAQSLVSATTFLVLINATKFVIILVDVFIMKTKHITLMQSVGAGITILAGVSYGQARATMEAAYKAEAKPLVDKSTYGQARAVLEAAALEAAAPEAADKTESKPGAHKSAQGP